MDTKILKKRKAAWRLEIGKRNQGIRRMRRDNLTLEYIGNFYGLTKQRVEQILKGAK